MSTEPTAVETIEHESAPEIPKLHPMRWARENLFSSPASSLLTIVVLAGVLFFIRGLLAFIFAPERQWSSISTNSRLYMTLAYPEADYLRVWISFGLVAALTGLSVAAWRPAGRIAPARITRAFVVLGSTVAIVALLSPWSASARVSGLIVGGVFAGGGWVARRALGRGAIEPRIPMTWMLAAYLSILVAAMWLTPVLWDRIVIADSTKQPLTVMALVAVAAYGVGRVVAPRIPGRGMQAALVMMWLLSLPFTYLYLLRAPLYDMDLVWSQDVPIAAVFAVAGAAILWVLSSPGRRELAGAVAAVLVVLALWSWFWPVNLMVPWIKARILLALLAAFAVGAPTFGGNEQSRRTVILGWVGVVAVTAFFLATGQAETGLSLQSDFIGGLTLTFLLAFGGILLSFPLGVLLALGRTSSLPIFRLLSTTYIEVVRGVPLITMLFFGAFFLPLFVPAELRISNVVKAVIAISLFSAAYLAENVRGGLQSIPKGQYEAARALGMSTAMMTVFITLPQALRAVIPALVGQVISLFKDTSLVAIIGLADLLLVASKTIPNQPSFIGSQRENLLFAAAVYWVFTYSFSKASMRLERKLGVGER